LKKQGVRGRKYEEVEEVRSKKQEVGNCEWIA
jgi:hypothetical protein